MSQFFTLANLIGRSLLLSPGDGEVEVRANGHVLKWSSKSVIYLDSQDQILFEVFEKNGTWVARDSQGQEEVFEKDETSSRLAMHFQKLGLPGSDWPLLVNAEDIPPPIEAEPVPEEDMHLFEEIKIDEQELEGMSDKVFDPFRLFVSRQPKPTSEVS